MEAYNDETGFRTVRESQFETTYKNEFVKDMVERGNLARAAILMWMNDPNARIGFGPEKDGKIQIQITAWVPTGFGVYTKGGESWTK